MIRLDTRTTFSLLWIIVMFNMVFADVISLYNPDVYMELTKFAGGNSVSLLLLIGAVALQIPIFMIFLSRVLEYTINRWANSIASVFTSVFVVTGGSLTPSYLFIASIEIICMILIIWKSWRWKKEDDT